MGTMKGLPMSAAETVDDRWIRRFHPCSDSGARLVCFPHAGGSASYYYPFSQTLAPGIEVLTVQYPGRQDRRHEPPLTDVRRIAAGAAAALEPWLGGGSTGPVAFFGHSMGAVVAYETALLLRDRTGWEPARLFASGRRAPSRPRGGDVHTRDDAGLVAELRRVGGTDERFLGDRELLAAILPVTRADYRAIETYAWSPVPPLGCPVTALTGDADPQTTAEEAAAWREHTTGPFELRVFPGGHFYLDAQRAAVVGAVRAVLPDGRPTRSVEENAS
jgi:surfactin synthase thioesterase subunit